MTAPLVAAILLLLGVALAARLASTRAARRTGLPRGQILYSDTGRAVGRLAPTVTDAEGVRVERPLRSQRYELSGRPDYLVRTREGVVPVEAKSAARPPAGPYESHVFQLAAYCLLVEEEVGERVPYGLIRYRDGEARVEYTQELREQLLALLAEMREARDAEEVHRSHEEPRRCARCAVREHCDERLD